MVGGLFNLVWWRKLAYWKPGTCIKHYNFLACHILFSHIDLIFYFILGGWWAGGQALLGFLFPTICSDKSGFFFCLLFGLSHDQVAFGAPERLEDTKTPCLEEALTLVGFSSCFASVFFTRHCLIG